MIIASPAASYSIRIGVDAYPSGPLRSCVRDVEMIERCLESELSLADVQTLTASDIADLVGTVIAAATLAYESTKTLFGFINGIQNAPRTLSDLRADIVGVQNVLQSFQSILKAANDADLSTGLRTCLESLLLPMESCRNGNNELRDKLEKTMSTSKNGKATTLEGVKLQFYENYIAFFKSRLAGHKSTISVGLGSATFILSKESGSSRPGRDHSGGDEQDRVFAAFNSLRQLGIYGI
ncbi:hypothetical protein ACJZ2D_008404 [Fusarium nematophilum]